MRVILEIFAREVTLESQMQAAFYAKQGPAREVLQVGEQPTPEPGPGEVRVHLKTSGVNPSDWKSRSGRTAPMSAPLIIPHSDGAGEIDTARASPIALASGSGFGTDNGVGHMARPPNTSCCRRRKLCRCPNASATPKEPVSASRHSLPFKQSALSRSAQPQL